MAICGERKRLDVWLATITLPELQQWYDDSPRGDWLLLIFVEIAHQTSLDRSLVMSACWECARLAAATLPDPAKTNTLAAVAELEALTSPYSDDDLRKARRTAIGSARSATSLNPDAALALAMADKVREIIDWTDITPHVDVDGNGHPFLKVS